MNKYFKARSYYPPPRSNYLYLYECVLHTYDMNKNKNNKSAFIMVMAAFLILAGAVFILNNPKFQNYQSLKQVESVLKQQNDELNNPLDRLGFTDIAENKKCAKQVTVSSDGKEVTVCTIQWTANKTFSNSESIETAKQAALGLEEMLLNFGWQIRDEPELRVGAWFDGVLSGKDWYPDAYSVKTIGNKQCILDYFVAYSNPATPTVRADFSCTTPAML